MVYIIILNWQGADDTIACLKSLGNIKSGGFKVIVCDNNSQDDSWVKLESYARCQTKFDLNLIQTGANLGFAGGNNVGLQIALSDPEMEFVWLLNNDTEVDGNALNKLMNYMAFNPRVGICGSTLLYMDKPELIQAVGGFYNAWLGTSRHALSHQNYSPTLCDLVDPSQFDYIVGASMFVRRSVLEQIGLLSEDYFLYCEEIDLATRMKQQCPEFKLGYAPESIVYHKEGASTGSNERAKKKYNYFADYFMLTSRIKFASNFFPFKRWTVQLGMLAVALNRIRRRQWRSASLALCLFFGVQSPIFDPRKH